MKGLEISGCKKVSQDKNSATFKHKDGHEIKIAISGLSPAMRKQLADLPLHQAEPEKEVEAIDKEAPAEDVAQEAEAPVEPAAPPASPLEPTNAAQEPITAAAAVPQEVPINEPTTKTATTPQGPMSTGAPAAPVAPVELTPEQQAAKDNLHDAQLADDYKYNKIAPKTYHDLFAGKSFLGKMGTIAGMLLSGAGSGLTHQPNALLDMMNKEIERDLEAQKQNQQNKRSWYMAKLEHEKAQPEIALRYAEAAKAGSEADQANNNNIVQGITDLRATNGARNAMTLGTAQSFQDNINKMAPGPARDAFQAQYDNVIFPAAMRKVMQGNQDTAEKVAQIDALNPQIKPNAVTKNKAQDFINGTIKNDEYQKRLKAGQAAKLGGGIIDPSKMIDPDDKELTAAITKAKVSRANYQDTIRTINKVAAMPNAGEAPVGKIAETVRSIPIAGNAVADMLHLGQAKLERPREQELNALGQRLMKSGESAESVEKFIKAISPSMFDSPEGIKNLEELAYEHFGHNDAELAGIFTKYPGLKNDLPRLKVHVPKRKPNAAQKAEDKSEQMLEKIGKSQGFMP